MVLAGWRASWAAPTQAPAQLGSDIIRLGLADLPFSADAVRCACCRSSPARVGRRAALACWP